MRYHLTSVRMAIIKRQQTVVKNMQKREPSCTVGRNVNWCSLCGNSIEVPQKIKNRTIIFVVVQSSSSIRLFMTPWTAACQASLSLTISQSLLKFMSIPSVDAIQPSHPLMPSSPSALNLSQHQGLFQWVGCPRQMTNSVLWSSSVVSDSLRPCGL